MEFLLCCQNCVRTSANASLGRSQARVVDHKSALRGVTDVIFMFSGLCHIWVLKIPEKRLLLLRDEKRKGKLSVPQPSQHYFR